MNVLGGYQKINVSTADLTASTLSVEGLSKACANANGKAVLVKMPDGTEVFGAVKEVTGGYQLSVMGADSKVSQLNVDDTDDTFTMEDSDKLASGVIGMQASSSKGAVTLSRMVSNPYTTTTEGYFYLSSSSYPEGSSCSVKVGTASGSMLTVQTFTGGSGVKVNYLIFLKKGMSIQVTSEANLSGGFYPLQKVES
jgi:hypothetical protein